MGKVSVGGLMGSGIKAAVVSERLNPGTDRSMWTVQTPALNTWTHILFTTDDGGKAVLTQADLNTDTGFGLSVPAYGGPAWSRFTLSGTKLEMTLFNTYGGSANYYTSMIHSIQFLKIEGAL